MGWVNGWVGTRVIICVWGGEGALSGGRPEESASGVVYPRCRFTVALRRRSGFFVWNVILPVALLTLLSFLSFAPEGAGGGAGGERMGVGDRMEVTLTLLLTVVALKFSVAANLPQVLSEPPA